MKSTTRLLICAGGIMIMCLATLLACEKKQSEAERKASLQTLAEQYWDKRFMDFDYKATYKMEEEEGSLPFSEYLPKVKSFKQIEYLSIQIKKVEIDKDKGVAYATVKFRIGGVPKTLEQTLKDHWVYKSGQWKHQKIGPLN